jgi:hypothetical protein
VSNVCIDKKDAQRLQLRELLTFIIKHTHQPKNPNYVVDALWEQTSALKAWGAMSRLMIEPQDEPDMRERAALAALINACVKKASGLAICPKDKSDPDALIKTVRSHPIRVPVLCSDDNGLVGRDLGVAACRRRRSPTSRSCRSTLPSTCQRCWSSARPNPTRSKSWWSCRSTLTLTPTTPTAWRRCPSQHISRLGSASPVLLSNSPSSLLQICTALWAVA